jgi:hypothetical protein
MVEEEEETMVEVVVTKSMESILCLFLKFYLFF